jgi:hypothetical protein
MRRDEGLDELEEPDAAVGWLVTVFAIVCAGAVTVGDALGIINVVDWA